MLEHFQFISDPHNPGYDDKYNDARWLHNTLYDAIISDNVMAHPLTFP